MAKLKGKRYQQAAAEVDNEALYTPEEAVGLVKQTATAHFDETIEMAVKLGVDPRHADQMVRGAVVLPAGTGQDVVVAVFAQGSQAEAAQEAGADIVGSGDLVERIEEGWLDFDIAVASPAVMDQVGRLGRILGPRGLMPNPKSGTVTDDIESAVKEIKAGKVEYRTDRGGNIHLPIGKAAFDAAALLDNFWTVIRRLQSERPPAASGRYFRSVALSATMGPSIKVNPQLLIDQS